MDLLERHLQRLRDQGHQISFHPEPGWKGVVVVHDHPIPQGYTLATSSILIRIPLNYPSGSPDMFWTDLDLLLAGGGIPANADYLESILGRNWRRFSWHPNGGWEPGRSDLGTYLGFIDSRLEQRR